MCCSKLNMFEQRSKPVYVVPFLQYFLIIIKSSSSSLPFPSSCLQIFYMPLIDILLIKIHILKTFTALNYIIIYTTILLSKNHHHHLEEIYFYWLAMYCWLLLTASNLFKLRINKQHSSTNTIMFIAHIKANKSNAPR